MFLSICLASSWHLSENFLFVLSNNLCRESYLIKLLRIWDSEHSDSKSLQLGSGDILREITKNIVAIARQAFCEILSSGKDMICAFISSQHLWLSEQELLRARNSNNDWEVLSGPYPIFIFLGVDICQRRKNHPFLRIWPMVGFSSQSGCSIPIHI